MQSRLKAQLARLEVKHEAEKNTAAVDKQLADAGDALELAARAALGAWNIRESALAKHSVEFQVGYQTACGELALVLRAMRRAQPPSARELAEVEPNVRAEMGDDTLLPDHRHVKKLVDDNVIKNLPTPEQLSFDFEDRQADRQSKP